MVIVSVKDVALLRPISCSMSTTTAVTESTAARYFFPFPEPIYCNSISTYAVVGIAACVRAA